jgi:hypothetical protein
MSVSLKQQTCWGYCVHLPPFPPPCNTIARAAGATASIMLARAILLTSVLGGVVRPAMAASPADTAGQDGLSDRMQAMEDAIGAAQDAAQERRAADQAAPSVPPDFNFRVNAPLYFNSNPKELQSGGPKALEGDPELELGWGRSLTSVPLKLSVKLRADTDRFANVPEAGEDEFSGTSKASYYDANNDQAWAPFVSYKGSAEYEGTFSPWTETINDFALGLDKLFNFDGALHRLPASARSRGTAVWSLGVSFFVQRRLRTPGPSSTALYVVPSATFVPSKDWSVSLFMSTRERWFDSVTSAAATTSRRDLEIEPIVTIAYDTRLPGKPQIALQASFERRSSNLANKSWNQWAVGPVLTANWRF